MIVDAAVRIAVDLGRHVDTRTELADVSRRDGDRDMERVHRSAAHTYGIAYRDALAMLSIKQRARAEADLAAWREARRASVPTGLAVLRHLNHGCAL